MGQKDNIIQTYFPSFFIHNPSKTPKIRFTMFPTLLRSLCRKGFIMFLQVYPMSYDTQRHLPQLEMF